MRILSKRERQVREVDFWIVVPVKGVDWVVTGVVSSCSRSMHIVSDAWVMGWMV